MVAGGSHTATQSTLENPCDPAPGGFDSEQMTSGQTFQITVNDTNPIWVYCETTGHCRSGMVFAVNPGTQLAQFQAAATGDTAPSTSSAGSSSSAGSTSQASSGSASSTAGGSSSSSSSSSSASASSTPNAGRMTVGDVSASVMGLAAALFGGLLAL
ncbi:hypothetical protein FRB91_008996 [Serendipita sp. 411]|nr:hypothetical protein FRC16_011260 [Serendipita sp. 398]KAG8850517.1 hypothetical protein FRB91_008996 [Serendipita sp. 411]